MGTQSPQDWEQYLDTDLVRHIFPSVQPSRVRRPSDLTSLPPGAYQALRAVIGRYGPEDLLIIPAAAWPRGKLRRRCLYTPLCVLGAGDRAAGLWVQALPEPGVLVVVPVSQIAAIEQVAAGQRHQLVITGHDSRLAVHYGAAGSGPAGAFAGRLRRRAAGPPGPVPDGSAVQGLSRSWRPVPGPGTLPLDGDEIAVTGRRTRRTGRETMLAVTSRELIIATRLRPARKSRTLYIPRQRFGQASIQAGSLRLRSAGTDVTVTLGSRKLAAAAASWLTELTRRDHIRADS
jgi:hypothetical protein